MSCTVIAVPYALFWVVGTLVSAAVSTVGDNYKEEISESSPFVLDNHDTTCDDVHTITEDHFIEKDFETPFMDKDILLKTLEEHGVSGIVEFDGKISGKIEGYS